MFLFVISIFKNDCLFVFYRYIDYIFGNESECKTFSRMQGWKTIDAGRIAVKMAALPKICGTHKRIVIITQGVDPVIVADDGKVLTHFTFLYKYNTIVMPQRNLHPQFYKVLISTYQL